MSLINSFVRRASSFRAIRSITSVRPYQGSSSLQNCSFVGAQFPTFVRLLTTPVAVEKAAGKIVTELSPRDGFPFALQDNPSKGSVTLTRKGQHEIVRVYARPPFECEALDVNNPCLHLKVDIYHGSLHRKLISLTVLASRDKICIFQVRVRDLQYLHLEEFSDFLKNKGIDLASLNYFSRVLRLEDSLKYKPWPN